MQRRTFVSTMISTGAVLTGQAPPFAAADNLKANSRVEKVKRAMLTMQRAAWEQGTASTALVEMEEKDLVLLFAKEALVRQKAFGWLYQRSFGYGSKIPTVRRSLSRCHR